MLSETCFLETAMSKTIVIDPVTRLEGHGKITLHLDA